MPVNNLSEVDQFPLNVIGPKGPHSFVGGHQAFFSGATGLISTSYGIPGVTIGRRVTGVYPIQFPPVQHVQIHPHLQVPTGHAFNVHVKGLSGAAHVVGISGYAEVYITKQAYAPSGTVVGQGSIPSLFVQPATPPTGSVLDLFFYASTSDPLGY